MPKYVFDKYVDLGEHEVYEADGTRVTEARADEIVAEVLADVNRRGRPSLTGKPEHSPQIQFRVSPDVKRRAEQQAAAAGLTVSQYARQLLEQSLSTGTH